jgi:hypothetical protein
MRESMALVFFRFLTEMLSAASRSFYENNCEKTCDFIYFREARPTKKIFKHQETKNGAAAH